MGVQNRSKMLGSHLWRILRLWLDAFPHTAGTPHHRGKFRVNPNKSTNNPTVFIVLTAFHGVGMITICGVLPREIEIASSSLVTRSPLLINNLGAETPQLLTKLLTTRVNFDRVRCRFRLEMPYQHF